METMNIGKRENGKYYADRSEQGMIYKDYIAFNHYKDDICYIAECGFDEGNDWSISEEKAREEMKGGAVETYNSMFAMVKEYLIDEFGENKICNEFVDKVCRYSFECCDWQCISTLMYETEWEEDLILYVLERAKERKDWNKEWKDSCFFDFIKDKIYDSKYDWDMIIDEFVNLPNY